jgi:AraC-like DNA-binding protein
MGIFTIIYVKMKFFCKVLLLCLLILPLGLLIPVIYDIMHLKFYVFPSADNLRNIEPLTDSIWDGKSVINDFAYDSEKLLFKYTLKNSKHETPNVFIIFWIDNHKPFVDLSQYTSLTLKIREATSQKVIVFIKTHEPGISSYEHQEAASLRHNECVVSLTPGKKTYIIDINEFITPGWWIKQYDPAMEISTHKETYTRVVSLDLHFIHRLTTPATGEEESLIIEEIFFNRPMGILTRCCSIFLVIYYIAGLILGIVFKEKIYGLLVGEKQDSDLSHRDKELTMIIEYIKQHYNDPDISTIQLQKTLGIPSLRIFNLIKEEYNFSFKQFINMIRIEESKRLLKESDLRVVEISTIIGFNDSSYFNKVFKQLEGVTPTDYREKK